PIVMLVSAALGPVVVSTSRPPTIDASIGIAAPPMAVSIAVSIAAGVSPAAKLTVVPLMVRLPAAPALSLAGNAVDPVNDAAASSRVVARDPRMRAGCGGPATGFA